MADKKKDLRKESPIVETIESADVSDVSEKTDVSVKDVDLDIAVQEKQISECIEFLDKFNAAYPKISEAPIARYNDYQSCNQRLRNAMVRKAELQQSRLPVAFGDIAEKARVIQAPDLPLATAETRTSSITPSNHARFPAT